MLTLYRTTCSVDRKHRPSHQLALLMVSDSRELLVAVMDSDAAELTNWAEDQEPEKWWEMDREEGEMRSFVFVEPEEDGSTTICYHILES